MSRLVKTKLEKLEKQRSQLEARIKQEKAKAVQQERKADTRRKILVGACIMARMETNDRLKKDVFIWLDNDLKRDLDRAMFGFGPRMNPVESDQNLATTQKAS